MSSGSQTPTSSNPDQYQDLVQYQQDEIVRLRQQIQSLQAAVNHWKTEGYAAFRQLVKYDKEVKRLRPALREALANYRDEKELRLRLEKELQDMRIDLDLCLQHEQKWRQQAEQAEEEISTLKVGQQLLTTLMGELRQELNQVRTTMNQQQTWRH